MDIYFLRVRAHPTEDHPRFGELRGAYVNCWIKASTPTDAERIAFAEIGDAQWVIDETEHPPDTNFERTEESADYLLQAQLDGECYVYHTYATDDERSSH